MSLNSFLRYAIISGIFSIPFIPLFVADHLFFPFITGKNFAFRIVVELMLAFAVILAIRDAAYRPRLSVLLYSFVAFLATMGISTMLAENPFKSFWSNFERMEGYITLLHLFGYFLVMGIFLQGEKIWTSWFKTTLLASASIVYFACLQLAGVFVINQGGVRLDGTLGNATYLAIYVVFHIFLALLLILREGNERWNLWEKVLLVGGGLTGAVMLLLANLGGEGATNAFGSTALLSRTGSLLGMPEGIALNLLLLLPLVAVVGLAFFRKSFLLTALILVQSFILYHTATRGAILGIIGGILLGALLIAVFDREEPRRRKISGAVVLGVLLFVGSFMLVRNTDFVRESPVLSRFASISLSESTTKSRFLIWSMAFSGFKERPIFGWGQENFNFVFNKYYSPQMYNQEQWFDRTHNVVLDWMIAGGLLGLLAYLSLFVAALYLLWFRTPLPFLERTLFTGLLAAYFFHNLFVFDNLVSYLIFFAILAYIHQRSTENKAPIFTRELRVPVVLLVPVVSVLLIGVLYSANVRPLLANAALIQAISPQTEGPSKNLENFKRAIAYGTLGTQEIREQLTQAALSARSADIPFELKTQFFELAITEQKKMADEVPGDTRHWLFLGGLLNSSGLYAEAIEPLSRALETSPGKQTVKFELAGSYMGLRRYDEALALLKSAFESEPGYREARVIYAAAAVYAGRLDITREVLEPVFGTIAVPDDRLVRAYRDAGRMDLVVQIFEGDFTKHPNDAQALLRLAAAYLEAGRRNDSIRALEQVIVLEPSFKEQATYYINEIRAGRNP